MASDPRRIALIANRWKNYDPQLYELFLREMDAYVFDVTVAVTEASNEDILTAKGRAQQARKFMQLFSETLDEPTQRATPPGVIS